MCILDATVLVADTEAAKHVLDEVGFCIVRTHQIDPQLAEIRRSIS